MIRRELNPNHVHIIKKLVRFLKSNKIHGAVLYNIVSHPAARQTAENAYQRIRKKFHLFDEKYDYGAFFYNAFLWANTQEGLMYWSRMSNKWGIKK